MKFKTVKKAFPSAKRLARVFSLPTGLERAFKACIVCHYSPMSISNPPTSGHSMPQILRQVICTLLTQSPNNTLCQGYHRLTNDAITCTHPSRSTSILCQGEWEELLQVIGVDPMIHLLSTCTVFVRVEDNIWLQLCGFPVSESAFKCALQKSCQKMVPLCKGLYRSGRFGLAKAGLLFTVNSDVFTLSQVRHKKLLEYHCLSRCRLSPSWQEDDRIARFLYNLCRHVFRSKLSLGLKRRLRKLVFMYVALRKYERMPVSDLLVGCGAKQTEQLLALFAYIFDHFIPQVISRTFHVTETAMFRNRLVYYRIDDWNVVSKPFKEQLISERLVKCDETTGLSLRLLPKPNGFRPIINLKRVNRLESTKAALAVLEFHSQSCGMSSSIIGGMSEILERLKNFSQNRCQEPVHMAKVDVEQCFDRINREQLMIFLRDLLVHAEYTVQRFDVVKLSSGVQRKRIYKATLPGCRLPLPKIRNSVVVERPLHCKTWSRERILSIVSSSISVTVKLDNDFFSLHTGIPQGSCLSTLLCSLFYAHLDQKHLAAYLHDERVLMMRYIDDMLIASCDQQLVHQVITSIQKGFPEYGFSVNSEKTAFKTCEWFSWCGLLLNGDMESRADYSRFPGQRLRDGLSVDRGRSGLGLQRFMISTLRPRLSPIYYHCHRISVTREVIMEVAAMFALRVVAYVREHDRFAVRPLSVRIILKLLDEAIRFFLLSMTGKARMDCEEMQNLFTQAVHYVFKCKSFKCFLEKNSTRIPLIDKLIRRVKI